VLGSRNRLTSSGDATIDRRQALTSPGMIDWVNLDGDKHCTSCAHHVKKHCWLYVLEMRRRGAKQNFWGPALPHGQRACPRWQKPDDEPGGVKRSSDHHRSNSMVSFAERYPRQGGTFLKADHLRGKPDLVAVIKSIDLNAQISNTKTGDVVRFEGTDFCLVLNHTTGTTIASLYGDQIENWEGNSIAMFCDESVLYEGNQGGVRVRPFRPEMGNGSQPPASRKPPTSSAPSEFV
jgi:hypothetical protein